MSVSAHEADELKPFLPNVWETNCDATAVAPNDPAWPIHVTTPSGQWAYALTFPMSPASLRDISATIDVEVTVDRGEVGIAFLAHDGSLLCEATRAEDDGRTIATVHLRSLARCGSLVFRNTSGDGHSSEVTIHNITATAGVVVDGEPPILRMAEETFGRYGQWSGRVPAGFMVDWLGIITHQDFDGSLRGEPVATMIAQDWDAWPEPPIGLEMSLDWVPLLEAVERAPATFTAVALGAGWGRWIVGGAVAAKKRGRDYHIVGVEAEPSHFAWMERHFRDNHIDLQRARAIHAAVAAHSGACWFRSGDSSWYGHSILAGTVSGADTVPLWAHTEVNGTPVQRVPCTDLVEVTAGLEQVDYLHLDIQGSEADVLLAHPALLDDRVACINVGTHSEVIERRLRTHFAAHGWSADLDIPMNGRIRLQAGEGPILQTEVGDGVQVWLNPRRVDVSAARGLVVPKVISA